MLKASPMPFPQTRLNTSDFPFVMVGFDGDSARSGFSIRNFWLIVGLEDWLLLSLFLGHKN